MFNLKNKPLAIGYFTKKSFSLLTVAIIGYLLTPAASAAITPHDCMSVGYQDNILNDTFFFNRDNLSQEKELISNGVISFKCIVKYGMKNIHFEVEIKNSTLVPGHSHVYTTNVPGLGIRYNLELDSTCVKDTAHPLKFSCPYSVLHHKLIQIKPKITLVNYDNNQGKPVGKISINPQLTLNYRIDNGPERAGLPLFPNTIDFNYKRRGCTMNTPSVKLSFGTVQASKFSGVKSTSQPSTVDKIRLNCDPDTSYFLTIKGKGVASHPDILELDQTSGQASGIGVQLEAGDSSKDYQKMILNEETYMHKTGNNGSGSATNKHIDIRARYFQTENKITPGTANASATFTITYQ
ncbi:fimbrial protein [Yersinia ruckeri]|uniref:fimbrial protein n=4 Tax=Yersinia ruckeri TaxID=29486 RepID=UPI002237F446|nr:fimbrial protein [Yersinia ruckeri]MCW6624634.1 type 1 fimbrial protein [Yersinia ruckeri]